MIQCPSCQQYIEDSQGSCPVCGWKLQLSAPGQSRVSLVQAPRRPKIQAAVLLAMLVDGTGSAYQFAIGILMMIQQILTATAAKAREVRVFTQIHRDEEYAEMPEVITSAADIHQAIEDSKKIQFFGGGDASETHADAIVRALQKAPWIKDSRVGRNVIILFTTADTKPLRCGRTLEELGEAIQQRGILYYWIGEPARQLERICQAAGGMFLPITNDPDPRDCQMVAAACSASIIQTVGSGITSPMIVVNQEMEVAR